MVCSICCHANNCYIYAINPFITQLVYLAYTHYNKGRLSFNLGYFSEIFMICHKDKNLRNSYWVAISVLLVLGVFALIFYRERTMFVDSSWFLLHIFSKQSFYFTEMRWGAFITQLGVLAGLKLNLSLQTLLIIYSVSFYLFYIVAALILGLRWRQYHLAILLVAYLTLFISDGFFCTVGEIFQGLTWMFLFLGLYFKEGKRHRLLQPLLLTAFAFLGMICHMIVVFPFAFLWIYMNLEHYAPKELVRQKRFWAYSILLLAMAGLRYYVSNIGWYDSMKLSAVHESSVSNYFAAFTSGHANTFFNLLIQNYWAALLLFGCGIALLILRKRYLKLSILLLFSLTYFAAMCVVFPDAYDRKMLFYFENEWAPLSVIMVTPFVKEIFKLVPRPFVVVPVVFLLVFAIRMLYIFDSCMVFSHRLDNVDKVVTALHAHQINKALIVEEASVADEYFVMNWGTPSESLLLSKLKGYEPSVTFKVVAADFEIRQPADSFYACFGMMPNHFLNPQYSTIDSTTQYHRIEGLQRFALKHVME